MESYVGADQVVMEDYSNQLSYAADVDARSAHNAKNFLIITLLGLLFELESLWQHILGTLFGNEILSGDWNFPERERLVLK